MLNFFRRQSGTARKDMLSGLTVALALVPEAIAFAFVAGLSPLIGLYSAFFIGLISAVLGGRPGMISGATGAMAVVVIALVAQHGIEYLFPTVILCGILQILVGVGRLGKFIRMVPQPVMLGFVNGLAIVILLSQFESFKTLSDSGSMVVMSGTPMLLMIVLVAVTMAIIFLLPKFTRAVPSTLAAILTVTLIALAVNHYTAEPGKGNALATVGDMLHAKSVATANGHSAHSHTDEKTEKIASEPDPSSVVVNAGIGSAAIATIPSSEIDPQKSSDPDSAVAEQGSRMSGGLPMLFFLQYEMIPFSWESFWIIWPYAITLCGVGLIESLMTLTLIDEMTETQGNGNQECVGQGTANLVCGLFGGMGGCAMIGQSLINVNSGGRGRLSGITAAVCLLLFILFLAPLIEQIPMAALTGVMFMVVIGTFEWTSLKMFGRMPKSDVFVMILVAGYTVLMHDLASAVILGVVVSALIFSWRHATHLSADSKFNEHGSKIYQLHGPLFFASVSPFKEIFDIEGDPDDVVIDFYYTRIYDQSGLEALSNLSEKYERAGKRLHVTHLSQDCRKLFNKAGDLVEVNHSDSPQFHVESDRLA